MKEYPKQKNEAVGQHLTDAKFVGADVKREGSHHNLKDHHCKNQEQEGMERRVLLNVVILVWEGLICSQEQPPVPRRMQ